MLLKFTVLQLQWPHHQLALVPWGQRMSSLFLGVLCLRQMGRGAGEPSEPILCTPCSFFLNLYSAFCKVNAICTASHFLSLMETHFLSLYLGFRFKSKDSTGDQEAKKLIFFLATTFQKLLRLKTQFPFRNERTRTENVQVKIEFSAWSGEIERPEQQ